MAREIPENACSHQNETVIGNTDNPYENTQIQCKDCGSVRFKSSHSQEKDLDHPETF